MKLDYNDSPLLKMKMKSMLTKYSSYSQAEKVTGTGKLDKFDEIGSSSAWGV